MAQLLPLDSFIDKIIAIEHSAHSHPWTKNILEQSEGKFDCHRALISENQVIGYFYSQCVAREAHLLNFVITPHFQQKGFGKVLLNHFLFEMKARDAQEIWLEVRESNHAAIKLYQSKGFNEFDRRYDYYPTATGREDALIMGYFFI